MQNPFGASFGTYQDIRRGWAEPVAMRRRTAWMDGAEDRPSAGAKAYGRTMTVVGVTASGRKIAFVRLPGPTPGTKGIHSTSPRTA